MREAKEIYRLIKKSRLSKEDQDRLHDWYREAHIKVTERAQAKLQRIRQWRISKIKRLQNKVLRRLK